MSSILEIYKYAALVTASYVRMGGIPLTGADFAREANAQQGGRLPLVLGQFLFAPTPRRPNPDPWNILHYYGGDVPGVVDNTGFAATLFERGGEKVLAIRGTEPFSDGGIDLGGAGIGQIGVLGLALTQVVSMVNLIQRMRAEPGTPAVQIRINASLIPPGGDYLTVAGLPPMFLSFSTYTAPGVGGIAPAETIKVTGHSLGGHLAYMAARLFPGVVDSQVYLYNAAGYDPTTADFFVFGGPMGFALADAAKLYLTAEFGIAAAGVLPSANQLTEAASQLIVKAVRGAGATQGVPEVVNLRSEDIVPGDDASIVASALTGAHRYPAPIDVPTEANSHVIEPLMDALALQALLYQLTNNTFTLTDITRLLEVSSGQLVRSEEALTEALYHLLLKEQVNAGTAPAQYKLLTSDATRGESGALSIGKGELAARAAFHDAALRIGDVVKSKPGLQLVSLAGADTLTMEANAFADIAYRYALKVLNPFSILGNDDLYTPHNQNGELNLYVSSTATPAGMTKQYIEDRAAMLSWKNRYYEKDGNVALRGSRTETLEFTDKTIKDDRTGQDLTLVVVGRNSLLINNPAKIVFGGEASETLIGSNLAAGDHLYGGGGDDTLLGNQGNDYLEGGPGNDTYVWDTGDGFDTILDTDGIGRLVVNGNVVSGGTKVAQGDYISIDKQQRLHFEGDPTTGGVLIVNGDLRIENFRKGDLGIVLDDQGSLAEIQPTSLTYCGATNTPVDEINVFGSDGNDHFIAGLGFSYFLGKSGDDLLEGNHWDNLHGGPGNDIVSAGTFFGLAPNAGDRVLTGGAGSDVILGGINGELIAGDMGDAIFSSTGESFSLDLFSYDAESQSGQYRNSLGEFGIPNSDQPIFFPGGATEALKYVLGISASTDLTTHYDDFIDGGDGPDWIFGGSGSDVLIGGAGDDVIDGDGFGPLFNVGGIQDGVWRDTVTRLLGQPGDDYLDGGPGNDRLLDQGGGNDVLIGGPGNDEIISSNSGNSESSYSDYLEGGEGNDRLFSLNRSPDGFDTLVGGPGDDRLTVQFGSAFLEGGPGSDNYVYFPSSTSRLVIDDYDDSGGLDRLYMVSTIEVAVSPADFVLTRDEANLYLSFGAVQERVTVLNWFAGSEYKIEQLVIGGFTGSEVSDVIAPRPDAQIYDIAAIEARFTTPTAGADFLWGSSGDDQIAGGLGDDQLFGSDGRDTLAGNEGQDTLDGGEDGDTYIFNIGDGIDHILDTGSFANDVIVFGPGITPDMLTLTLGSLLIKVGENGDAIHLDGFEPDKARGSWTIEHFQFADGAMLTYQQLLDRGFDLAGTVGDDVLVGTSVNDRFAGGQGSDMYSFGRGSGQDLIEDLDSIGADTDVVRVAGGIAPADITVTRANDFITLAINGTSDELSIRWQPQAGYQVERFEFADGTLWDAAMLESMAVTGGGNSAPTLANAVVDQTADEDSPLSFAIPAGTFVDADPGETLAFSAALVDGSPLPGWLSFDAGAQSFSGTPANEDVGTFDVTVTATDTGGLAASDTFQLMVANKNDAPVLEQSLADQFANQNAPFAFPVPPGTFADVDVGDRLVLSATLAEGAALPVWLAFDPAAGTLSGTPSEFDVGGIEIRVTATDRAGAAAFDTFTLAVSDASVVNETHVGTRRDDVIVTGFANDWIDAGGGGDWVRAGAGRDVILGGRGNDRLAGGAGNDLYIHDRHGGHDVIEETGGLDTLLLGEGITPAGVRLERRRDDLVVDLKGADGSVTVMDWFASEAAKVETIQFADGTAWDVDEISAGVRRNRSGRHRDDDSDHAHHHGGRDDDHHGKSDGRKHDDEDGSRPEHKPDRIAHLLEAVLARKPQYDFDAPELELGRPQRRGEELGAQEIARRWEVIRRYANGAASERDEGARGGAVHRFDGGALAVGLDFGKGSFDTGWSELTRGAANLRTLKGLEEGLQRLRG